MEDPRPVRWELLEGDTPSTVQNKRFEGHSGPIIYSSPTLYERDEVDIIHCLSCNYLHAIPLPGEKKLELYYKDQFYQVSKPEYIEKYESQRAWWEMTHRHVLQDYLGKKDWFLEIGPGPGIAMDVAKDLGAAVTLGIEINKSICTMLEKRGHAMFEGSFYEFAERQKYCLGGAYNIIYLWEVVEHIPDLEFLFETIYNKIISDDGYLIVTVPNDFSPLQKRVLTEGYVDYPWWVSYPEHLNYFSPKSLQLLLKRMGFKVIDMWGTYPLESFILSQKNQPNLNYVGNDEIGREVHQRRMGYEFALKKNGGYPEYLNRSRDYMVNHGIGREIVCIAKRA